MILSSIFNYIKKVNTRYGVVLMYHRIANFSSDPWELAVSPENFEEHLKILKAYNVISTEELEDIIIKKSKIPSKTVIITFDDGYRDNFLAGKPLLEKYNFPATFFITTDSIGKEREFWWDTLERICLHSENLPKQLNLEQLGFNILDIGNSENMINHLDLYYKLCDIVREMPAKQQQNFIKTLKAWANNDIERAEFFAMNIKELLDLQSNKLFTIGAHTMTHPFLPNFSFDYQKKEIEGSVAFLKKLTGKSVKYLAYPHGGRNQDTLTILANSSIDLAFTTKGQLFNTDTKKHMVPRFQVCNWNGEQFASNLNTWLRN